MYISLLDNRNKTCALKQGPGLYTIVSKWGENEDQFTLSILWLLEGVCRIPVGKHSGLIRCPLGTTINKVDCILIT